VSPGSRQGTTTDHYELFGGRYFGEFTSLDLAAGATRQTTELTITCITSLCLSGTSATQLDTDDWSVGALHVRQRARLSYSITARVAAADIKASLQPLLLTLPPGTATTPPPFQVVGGFTPIVPSGLLVAPFTGSIAIPDERETYSIGGELFPTARLGLRIGFARTNGDTFDDESYDVAATWFFMRAAAVQFVVARTESQLFSLRREIDTAELRLFGRL
jgi:hypothetical protein